MDYKGKLYALYGGKYVELRETAEDIDNFKKRTENCFKQCKALFEAQGVTSESRIGGDIYAEVLELLKNLKSK
jgi:hypothetical protein